MTKITPKVAAHILLHMWFKGKISDDILYMSDWRMANVISVFIQNTRKQPYRYKMSGRRYQSIRKHIRKALEETERESERIYKSIK